MRIERVDGNRRIKVLLTQNDLIEMNINVHTLTAESPELHGFIFKVMDYINRETGFNAKSGQIVVEASPSEEGVVLTVTKIQPEAKPAKKPMQRAVRAKSAAPKRRLFRFLDFDALSGYMCLADDAVFENASLYEYDGAYFLMTDSADNIIAEFSVKIPASVGSGERFFAEHGSIVAENEQLVKMAAEIKKLK